MNNVEFVTKELKSIKTSDSPIFASPASINAVIELVAEGATVPFIARYRKEKTGGLDEVAIQGIIDAIAQYDEIIKRQTFIAKEIESQNKLDDALKVKIFSSFELNILEDLYLPFKKKRKTKATIAKEAGLESLSAELFELKKISDEELGLKLKSAVNKELGFESEDKVLEGIVHIWTERLSEIPELRAGLRKSYFDLGFLYVDKGEKSKDNSKFERYFGHVEKISSLIQEKNSHRYLAIRRGWTEEELSVNVGGAKIDTDSAVAIDQLEVKWLSEFESVIGLAPSAKRNGLFEVAKAKAARLSLKAYVLPSIVNEIHAELKSISDREAIAVFADNLRQVLMASPLGSKRLMALDPGIRTGVKAAILTENGDYLLDDVFFFDRKEVDGVRFLALLDKYKVEVVAVGNGTNGRETEIVVKALLKSVGAEKLIPVVLVNESGASIYSASPVAREEFPKLDITVRGAISIGRRLQDPLSELVKIDPKSIGVGQYQHDVSQPALKKTLSEVVLFCVNRVGVDLNTASVHVLSYISGVGPGLAKAIVEYRLEKGAFKSRKELLKVPRFSPKVFEQSAGFLRISASEHPLDRTGIHPELYPALESFCKRESITLGSLLTGEGLGKLQSDATLKKELGDFTFSDVIEELKKPGRDPRDAFELSPFRDDIFEVKDLKSGMKCPGVVTNVTNFGAFVDIGVHQDGLVHISKLSDTFVKDPRDVVKSGQRVTVWVEGIDTARNQISLTMKDPAAANLPRSEPVKSGASMARGSQQGKQKTEQTKFGSNPFAALAELSKRK
jgi:protein Tex